MHKRKKRNLIIGIAVIGVIAVIIMTIIGVCVYRNRNTYVQEFSYENVLVTLTPEASLMQEEWTRYDFSEFAFARIRSIGIIGEKMVLVLYLAEPSRDNVLRAVEILNAREDVYHAGQNWFVWRPVVPSANTEAIIILVSILSLLILSAVVVILVIIFRRKSL